jgi:hypothetical protein
VPTTCRVQRVALGSKREVTHSHFLLNEPNQEGPSMEPVKSIV